MGKRRPVKLYNCKNRRAMKQNVIKHLGITGFVHDIDYGIEVMDDCMLNGTLVGNPEAGYLFLFSRSIDAFTDDSVQDDAVVGNRHDGCRVVL